MPPVVKFGGVLPGAQGPVSATFALYADPAGGTPIWTEAPTVAVAAGGRCAVALGATRPEGLPPVMVRFVVGYALAAAVGPLDPPAGKAAGGLASTISVRRPASAV